MSKLRLLVVDDEPLIRKDLRNTLASLPDLEIIAECGSGQDAIREIANAAPDLVLLDVQMPDCSGLDVVREVGAKHMPAVILVTAYDDYAVRAFELNAVDYVLKPFEEARLRDAVGNPCESRWDSTLRLRCSRPGHALRCRGPQPGCRWKAEGV